MNTTPANGIGAVVLAAGMSTRMGKPKMLLPWGNVSIIEKVVTTLLETGISPIIVVIGGSSHLVEEKLSRYPVKTVYNPNYSNGEMLCSIQTGIESLPLNLDAALIALGDQPQIEIPTISAVISKSSGWNGSLIVPSYHMRRGHPWLIPRGLWTELLGLRPPQTMRDFLNQHSTAITYVEVDSASILADLDTMDEYHRSKPGDAPPKFNQD